MNASSALSLVALCAILALQAPAQQPPADDATTAGEKKIEQLEARVTAVNGRIVTIDRGRSSGLEAGDLVRFLPLGSAAIEGVVRLVEEEKASVELEAVELAIVPGVRSEVLLPSDRAGRQASAPPARPVPEHPPWQQPLDAWKQSQPLLAPAQSPEPEERPADLHGRAFTRFGYVDESVGDGRSYLRSLSGLDFDWSNPFSQGGRLQFDGEVSYRDAEFGSGDSETETIWRFSRFSYAVGGERGRPHRVEGGRFLQHEFPELGVLDGVEYAYRTGTGDRLGASVGFLPEPFDEMQENGQDLAASVFYRFVSDEDERFTLGTAYQMTWHEGEADRDLILSTADWRIAERTTFRGAAWIDHYGADELVKPEGFELTELHLRLDQRFEAAGAGIFASQVRWPDLRRNALPPTTDTGVADHSVRRAGVDGWGQATSHLRLGARLEGWDDEVDSGLNGEVRAGLRDVLYEQGSVDFAVFRTQGRFSDGIGGRVSASHMFGQSALRLSYDLTSLDQIDFTGEQGTLLQHAVRAGFDTVFGTDWSFSVDAETRFGDEQGSVGLGFYLQRSF